MVILPGLYVVSRDFLGSFQPQGDEVIHNISVEMLKVSRSSFGYSVVRKVKRSNKVKISKDSS